MVGPLLFSFAAGLVAGSFVSVVAHRVPRGLSIVGPRSSCPQCGSRIAGYDNVPLASWLALRGRCRSCRRSIPARYPLVELGLGISFAATTAIFVDAPVELALGLVLVSMLAAVTLTDLEGSVIPNRILFAGALIGVAIVSLFDPGDLAERAVAAAGAGGFLLIVAFAHPRGMGMGDVKLAAAMGLFLGAAVVPALFIAFATGALAGLWVIVREGAAARKRAVPFGPFLALGGVLGLWFGDAILAWYLTSFFATG